MAPRLLTRREAFQAPAVHEENIQPAIVVVVIESQAAAGSFQKIFVLTLAAIDGFYGQARLFDHIHEAEAERSALNRRLWSRWSRHGFRVVAAFDRPRQFLTHRHQVGKRKYQRGPAYRRDKRRRDARIRIGLR